MKYRVLKKFRDKITKEVYKVDRELELSDERVKEIMDKDSSLIEQIKDEEVPGDVVTPEDGETPGETDGPEDGEDKPKKTTKTRKK